MEVGKVNFLISKAKEVRSFCDTYNNLSEYNTEKNETEQFTELKHNFCVSFDQNVSFLHNSKTYLSKYASAKEGFPNMGSPWIDFICYGKNKNGEITNLLNMDLDAAKLFWEGFKEYINDNKDEIFDYISTYMLANISEKYKDELKKEKEKIENMINSL